MRKGIAADGIHMIVGGKLKNNSPRAGADGATN